MSWKEIPAALREEWPEEQSPLAERWRELLGPHVPEDLARLGKMHDGGFLLSDPGDLLGADNCFESAIELARLDDHLEPLLQVFTSTWFLSNLPAEGDCLMLHCSHARETAEVLVWSHEEGFFLGPVAWDLPTARVVLSVYDDHHGDAERRAALLAPALGRYADKWPFNTMERSLAEEGVLELAREQATQTSFEPGESAFEMLQGRAFWIAEALLGRVSAEEVKEQLEWTPHEAMARPFFASYAPSGLYWLWRSYFLEEEWLDEILTALRDSPSRLVRDAARLVDELLAGARSEVEGVDLVQARRKVAAALDALERVEAEEAKADAEKAEEASLVERIEAGPIRFERDDGLVEALSAAPPHCEGRPVAPRPPTASLNPTWPESAPVLATHPQGDRVLVSGHHDHPLTAVNPHYPNTPQGALFEVTRDGSQVIMTCDTPELPEIHEAAYLGGDLVVAAGRSGLVLIERHGPQGLITGSTEGNPTRALLLDEGRTALLLGLSPDDESKNPWATVKPFIPPGSVHVYRIDVDDRLLGEVARAELPVTVTEAIASQEAVVVGDPRAGVALRVEGLDTLSTDRERELELALRPALFKVMMKPNTRQGPAAVTKALGQHDHSYSHPEGRGCVLKFKEDGFKFQVCVGDEEGLRPAEPALEGTPVVHDFWDAGHSVVYLGGWAWVVDLVQATARRVLELPAGVQALETLADHGFAFVVNDELVCWHERDGEVTESLRIEVGPGAATIISLLDKRVVAMKTAQSPLVLLALGPGVARLLGAVDPADAGIVGMTFETYQHPCCYYRLFGRRDERLYGLFGLDRALAQLDSAPVIEARLPDEPWKVRRIRCKTG